ncbi:hypothetical protein [Nannocystis pusilla]|uniref:Uncharacterized protein n=1 Tax=Nannocystis pusilla TaxID=889268 RepID=A0ABS7TXD6_9BACT|nr:hypothetical protein [Nannocystis pusilla]MBZ5712917.1 hypothetical protein [Nannocystis pusilla]
MLDFDLSTTRRYKYTRPPKFKWDYCGPDRILIDAMLSFVRVEDGEVELEVPVTVYRDDTTDEFRGEAMITSVDDFVEGLHAKHEHDTEALSIHLDWRDPDGDLFVDFFYGGQTTDSPTTGHGNFEMIAEFSVPE